MARAAARRKEPEILSAERLNDESVAGWMATHSTWKREGDVLTKDFTFKSFRDSIVFVNRVAALADTANHHPDIDIRSNRVRLVLSTRSANGITERDLHLAEEVDFATSAR